MKNEKKYRLKIYNFVLLYGVILVFLVSVAWLIAVELLRLDHLTAASISVGIGLIVALVVATIGQKTLSGPLNSISSAITHVLNTKAQQTVEISKLGEDYVRELSQQIFNIAAMGSKHASEIDAKRAYIECILKSIPLGVFVFDKDGMLQFANEKGRTYLDINYKDAVGMHQGKVLPLDFQSDETLNKWLEFSKDSKIKNDKFWERVSLVRTDASRHIFDVVAHYSKDDSAGIETVLVVNERTEEYIADETELDFVAVAAHELRGPITIIRGYLDVFEDELKGTFTVEQLGLLQKASVSAEQLSDTVNNILNIARIDQEHMSLHIRESNWADVINEAYENLRLRAQVHGRTLKLDIPETLPNIAVDHSSIMEVINNLVDNAIKYSPEGGEILISVKHDGDFISTTVQDNGVGIPKSVIGNLFKKFYRSHRTKQTVTGTGLGLYISKVIVDSHGGNIWVRSKEGHGATFGFELPTYESVADALKKGHNDGQGIKRSSHGWIKNHSMHRS